MTPEEAQAFNHLLRCNQALEAQRKEEFIQRKLQGFSSLPPELRYQRDMVFRQLVDFLESYLKNYQLSPVELREAAMLAAYLHESRRLKPLLYPAEAPSFSELKANFDETSQPPSQPSNQS